jgi:hypothetical protein
MCLSGDRRVAGKGVPALQRGLAGMGIPALQQRRMNAEAE